MSDSAEPLPPLLDEAVLNQVAAYLPAAMLETNLHRLAELAEALLGLLSPGGACVVEQVHRLAGSSGMLGFRRLAAACLRFEAACSPAFPAKAAARAELRAVLEATLPEITCRLSG
ncbi:Hpt domain-containing protein [Paeniroseomonas aquatica]|uniref:Hpt domain-containing protein n=1 Tax=Paeniroseomonas aquatica TaxID=373043 RepID=A0ABT8A6P6_9PROT|nr:Hpt domain-containing protein [Paeniroseomonas aquatica]MDN3565325.1 Hpt domain-containing protein [Paeniroseomonas aquatica]